MKFVRRGLPYIGACLWSDTERSIKERLSTFVVMSSWSGSAGPSSWSRWDQPTVRLRLTSPWTQSLMFLCPTRGQWQLLVPLTCSQCGTRLFSAVSRCLHDSGCAQNHLSKPADTVAWPPHRDEKKTPPIFGIKLFVMEGVFCLLLSVLF